MNTELRQLAGCLDLPTWNRLGCGHLPEGATGFTTVEFKSNSFGTARG